MTKIISILPDIIYEQFLEYYGEFINIAERAPMLFVAGELDKRLKDDLLRVQLYRSAIDKSVATAQAILVKNVYDRCKWKRMRKRFRKQYGNELATTYFTSVMRKVFSPKGVSIEFKNDGIGHNRIDPDKLTSHYSFKKHTHIKKIILTAFNDSVFSGSLSDKLSKDTDVIVDIIHEQLKNIIDFASLEVLRTALFRGKGAYIVGQLKTKNVLIPIIFCIVYRPEGVTIDAVLVGYKATRSFLFSSTRSAFTVSTRYYRELHSFIQRLFPQENPAYIFDLIGFTHPAKVALLQQLRKTTKKGAKFQHVGTGPVDLVFGLKGFPLIFKVLRGGLPDRKSIITNFLKVHETDRLGQVLDSLDYRNLKFKRKDFTDELIKKLGDEQSEDVVITSEFIFFKRVYASRRIVQVPEYIRTAGKKEVQQVLLGVGWNIKHLAAMGFLPSSLGLEHFGFTRWGRVVYLNNASLINIQLFLFRYQGDMKLGIERYSANPSTFERELNIPQEHRDMFRTVHGDLYFPQFWEDIKVKVFNGQYPDIFPYPSRFRVGSRRFRNSLVEELNRLSDTAAPKQIRIVLENLAVIHVELAGLSFLRLEVPHPNARVLVVEPIGPEIIAQLHRQFQDVTFDILQSESEVVESAGQWTPGIHGKLKALVQVRRYDYVIGYVNETFDHDFFRLARLKGFLLLSTGTHNIDIKAATGFHTVVTNAPGPTTTTVAEQNIGLILDAIYSQDVHYGNRPDGFVKLESETDQQLNPLIVAHIMWLCLLQRTLKLNEMFAFGSSQRYVRTGVGKHATVYHDQIGQNKEAGIIRSIGVVGLKLTGLHLIEFAITHEISTIYVLEREFWGLPSEDRERLEELIAIIKETSQTEHLSIQIIPINKSALLAHATLHFQYGSKRFKQSYERKTSRAYTY